MTVCDETRAKRHVAAESSELGRRNMVVRVAVRKQPSL